MVGQSDDEPELEEKYCAAYAVLLNNRVTEQLLDLNESNPFFNDEDFRKAVVMSLVRQSNHHSHEHKIYKWKGVLVEEVLDEDEERMNLMPKLKEGTHVLESISDELASAPTISRPLPWPSVTEVEDDDNTKARSKPKIVNPRYILEEIDESKRAEPPPILYEPSEDTCHAYNASRTSIESQLQDDLPNPCKDFTLPFHDLPGPPTPLKQVHLPKARVTKPGASAIGISVLSTRGRLAMASNPEVDLCLDSCADITLISEDLYLSLKNRPPLQQGYQMQIFQLTEKGTHIKGFIRIPVFMEAMDGTVLETEAEAYVVPNMTVPILLGKDYHLTYELNISRSVTEGSYLHFTGTPYSVPAMALVGAIYIMYSQQLPWGILISYRK